jgi:hypothetical protein
MLKVSGFKISEISGLHFRTLICGDVFWTVGSSAPNVAEYFRDPGMPVPALRIEADGDELLWITTHFRNIPLRLGANRKMVWTGETARFILENLV